MTSASFGIEAPLRATFQAAMIREDEPTQGGGRQGSLAPGWNRVTLRATDAGEMAAKDIRVQASARKEAWETEVGSR